MQLQLQVQRAPGGIGDPQGPDDEKPVPVDGMGAGAAYDPGTQLHTQTASAGIGDPHGSV